MEKRKIVFYLTIGMILILHLTACTNRSSELPAPDSTVFGYEGETKIIFDGVCAKYNDKKEKNQVFLPIEYSARDCAPQPLKLSIHSGGIEHPCRRR